jgi:membrane protease YdiL (CAAX protease family)
MERPEDRLGRRGAAFLLGCALLAAATLILGLRLYPGVFPEASIPFETDREDSEGLALDFLKGLGVSSQESKHASRFLYDDHEKVFLERTLGLEDADSVFTGDLRIWRWAHRWFRPLEKEEVLVEVATTGEVVAFVHTLEEDAPGDSLAQEDARRVAEAFLSRHVPDSAGRLAFLEASTLNRPHRIDHLFTWEVPGWDVGGGKLRHSVRVQGSEVGGYRLFLQVPEAWTRSYEALRSKNQSAGTVAAALYTLTILALLGVLVARIRRRDVQWRPALVLGGAAVLFTGLGGLNGFSGGLFDYDTRTAFDAFLLERIGGLLIGALATGVFIFLLTAGAEPLYRERYGDKISLGGFFRPRALRTRRFLLSAVLGLTLTCAFFAYQMVFYKAAARFGAWSPAEVPYSELLNTAIPWAFLLLTGFLPAVSEEFISRMFSVPFFSRVFRSAVPAVVVPAFIWGFSHAGYPNQPFYIRGLEVGLAGLAAGVLMLRFDILALLVWHYTIDALYTGTLLLKSGDPYSVVSTAVVGGLFLLPVAYALAAYAAKGRFLSPEPLLNRTVGTAPPRPAGPAEERIPLAPRPVGARKRLGAAAFLAAGVGLTLLPSESLYDAESIRIGEKEAVETARRLLAERGSSPDTFRIAATLEDPRGRHDRLYLVKALGQAGAADVLERTLVPVAWRVRAFQELREEEWVVGVDARRGGVFFFRHTVAESEPGDALAPEEAEERARAYLEGSGVDLSRWEVAEIEEEIRPSRADHTVIFQSRADLFPELGDARIRRVVGVHGGRIRLDRTELKIPEAWTRDRETTTFSGPLRIFLYVLVAALGLALVIWQVLTGHRTGGVRWKPAFLLGALVALLFAAARLNAFSAIRASYMTSIPWSVHMVLSVTLIVLVAVLAGLVGVLAFSFVQTVFPRFWDATHPATRRGWASEAVAATAALTGLALLVAGLRRLLEDRVSDGALPGGADLPAGANGALPFVSALSSVVFEALIALMALGLAGRLLGDPKIRVWVKAAGGVLLALALVPLSARTGAELAVGLAAPAVAVAGGIAILRWHLRDNPWSYILGALAVAAVRVCWGLAASGIAAWRIQGVVLLALCLVFPCVILLRSPKQGPTGS